MENKMQNDKELELKAFNEKMKGRKMEWVSEAEVKDACKDGDRGVVTLDAEMEDGWSAEIEVLVDRDGRFLELIDATLRDEEEGLLLPSSFQGNGFYDLVEAVFGAVRCA